MLDRRRARLDLHSVALILRVPAALASVPIVCALIAGEALLSIGFVALVAAALALAFALSRFSRAEGSFSTGETLASAALAWALVMVLGALPFWIGAEVVANDPSLAPFRDPVGALFESVSGFTSTGLTVVGAESELPATVQLWRSLMQWTGGAGLALLMLTVMNPDRDGGQLSEAELSLPEGESVHDTARAIWAIYGGLTLLGMVAFLATGQTLWQSVNHGMTAVATGGFTVTDESFGDAGVSSQCVALALMLLGAISFGDYRTAVRERRPWHPLRRPAVLTLLLGVLAATGVLWLARLRFDVDAGPLVVPFQAVSAFTTSGFSNTTIGDWHSAPLAVLIACMTIGGASGATTGGIKTDRALLVLRGIHWRVRRLFGGGKPRVIAGERHSSERARLRVEGAAMLVTLWIATWLVGCLALAPVVADSHSFTEIAFEVMSAQSGVGLSVGIAGAELAASGKAVLMVLMWAGRLELLAAFALLWLPFARVGSVGPRGEG